MLHGPLLYLVRSTSVAKLQANDCVAGRGFVTVDALGKPLLYDDRRELDPSSARAVSVFHQLHCLVRFFTRHSNGPLLQFFQADSLQNALRVSYYAADAAHHKAVSLENENENDDHHPAAHVKHCFDYLRQALMCAADMTLEPLRPPQRPPQKGKILGVNGWGVEHTCRHWGEVRMWTEERRATGQSGIN